MTYDINDYIDLGTMIRQMDKECRLEYGLSDTKTLYPLYYYEYKRRFKRFWRLYNYDYTIEYDRARYKQLKVRCEMLANLLGYDPAVMGQPPIIVETVLKPSLPSHNIEDYLDRPELLKLCRRFIEWQQLLDVRGIVEVLLERGESLDSIPERARLLSENGWNHNI